MDAPVLYLVKFWVSPEGHRPLMDWLEGGHNAEVLAQPGFRFFQRVKLEQDAEDGWLAYAMIYGVESREALEAYFNDTALAAKFAAERAPFAQHLRMDRAWGRVERTLSR